MDYPDLKFFKWEEFGTRGIYSNVPSINYTCGYCSKEVSSSKGLVQDGQLNYYAPICPSCNCVSMIENTENGFQYPGVPFGREIAKLPDEVKYLYSEVRDCYKVGAYTAVILLARKCLSNVAVDFGAEDGRKFAYYVSFLVNEGHVAKKNKDWIDEIRVEGNEATHNKASKNKEDATKIMKFLEMLLLTNYEFSMDDE